MRDGLWGLLGIANGIGVVRDVAHAIAEAADALEPQIPQVATLVREAAQTIEGMSTDLHERSLGEIAGSVSRFAREEPIAFLGGAVLAGFILSRLAGHGSANAQR